MVGTPQLLTPDDTSPFYELAPIPPGEMQYAVDNPCFRCGSSSATLHMCILVALADVEGHQQMNIVAVPFAKQQAPGVCVMGRRPQCVLPNDEQI